MNRRGSKFFQFPLALSIIESMPLVPRYTWEEDASSIALEVHLPGIALSNLLRRFSRVGQYSQAKTDYGVAYSMDNQNQQLREDFMELVLMERANQLKETGDSLQGGQIAVEKYSESLTLNPLSIACLSNRAACYLMQHAAKQCIEDCTRALELQQDSSSLERASQEHGLAFFSIGPAAGSAQRRAWVVKTLVRRGAAHLSAGDLDKGKLLVSSGCSNT